MNNYHIWAEEVLNKVREKMEWVSEKNKDKIPYTTDSNGCYDDRSATDINWDIDNGLNWWTNGFWGGIMWLLYNDTRKEKYLKIAQDTEAKLNKCFEDFYGLHHDVGFMFLPTAVANYKITGNATSKKTAMHAANLLAGRFNPIGKYIRAWNDLPEKDTKGWAIIDCLFNISLLYWASEESGDPRFRHIAMLHADTVMNNFIREDGSVCHIVEFDSETGKTIRSLGGQGYTEGSSWTRGQGWALYGFTNSYIHTKKQAYLDTAIKVANYIFSCIPENGIIPVDFRQPSSPDYEDSCAACVIASGLLELSKYVPLSEKEKYINTAIKLLKTLVDQRTDWSHNCDAIIQNCTAAYHDKKHHFTMVYADYYFIEALYKLTANALFIW